MNDPRMSRMAIHRIIQDRIDDDPNYKAELEGIGRPFLRQARDLDDEALLAKLAEICGPIDRQRFARLTQNHDSAEDLADEIIEQQDPPLHAFEEDWLWFALLILWERWQPTRPSFEMIDDWIHEGYPLVKTDQLPAAYDLWLRAWKAVTEVCARKNINSVEKLDDYFCGTHPVIEWMQDFVYELGNAPQEETKYRHDRLDLCRSIIGLFTDLDPQTLAYIRCGIGQSLQELGDADGAYEEFSRLAQAFPTDASIWCRWAGSLIRPDLSKAVSIIECGLARSDLDDREDLLHEAIQIGSLADRYALVERADNELLALQTASATTTIVSPTEKVGRNAPCPCGSGKKYKKCCLGSTAVCTDPEHQHGSTDFCCDWSAEQ